jgi:hypothetical protein
MVEGQAPETNGRPVLFKELSRQTSLAPSTQLLSPGLQTVGWILPARMSLCEPPDVTCVARTKIVSPEAIVCCSWLKCLMTALIQFSFVLDEKTSIVMVST